MKMPARTASLLLFLTLFSAGVCARQAIFPYAIGNAFDKSQGNFIYSEHHFCDEQGLQCRVEYRDRAGAVFAEKQLDYRESPLRPSLVMKDYRRDVEVRVAASDQDNLVVDAGFDNFVRSIWNDLIGGGSVDFSFLVAGFDKSHKMRANRKNGKSCSSDELCVEINLDSWLLSRFLDPIELYYSRADRKLLRFSGRSNIKGENDELLNVDIHYRYEGEVLAEQHASRQLEY